MKKIIIVLGAFFILSGVSILLKPSFFSNFLEQNQEAPWLYYTAIIGRLIIGILLIISARHSKYPIPIKILGFLAFFAALFFLYVGHTGFQDLIKEAIQILSSYSFIAGLLGIAIGTFMIYAFVKKANSQ